MKITDDIIYVGVNDHDIDLFEGQYIVPNGMACLLYTSLLCGCNLSTFLFLYFLFIEDNSTKNCKQDQKNDSQHTTQTLLDVYKRQRLFQRIPDDVI